MRRIELLLALGMFAGSVSGCSCVGKEFTVKQNFTVAAGAGSALCTTDHREVNLLDDSAFNQAKANIGKVELTKLTVTIVNPNVSGASQATKASGKVKVSALTSGAAATELGTYQDVPIEANASQDISYDAAAASTLAGLVLNPPNAFDVVAEGCNDQVPASYTFQVLMTFFAELKL